MLRAALPSTTAAASRLGVAVANRAGGPLPLLHRGQHPRFFGSVQSRSFFWSGGNSGDSGDGDGGDEGGKKNDPKGAAAAKGGDGDAGGGGGGSSSSSDDGNDKRKPPPSSSSGSGVGGGGVILPSRQGFGDESPRYPHLLALPVLHRPLFPGVVTNVTLTDPATINALEDLSNKGAAYLGVFLRKGEGATGVLDGGRILETPEIITDADQIHSVGTFAQIHRFQRGGMGGLNPSSLHAHSFGGMPSSPSSSRQHGLGGVAGKGGEGDKGGGGAEGEGGGDGEQEEENDIASLLLLAHRRIDRVSVDNYGPPIDVTVKHWDRLEYNPTNDAKTDDMIRALSNEVLSTIREVAASNAMFREQIAQFPLRIDANDPYRLADFATSITTGSPDELQAVLEERDVELRLQKALVLLSKEREVTKLQQEISAKVEEKMSEAQRRYFLTEQLKSIKKELGMEVDDKEALIEKYRKKLAEYSDMPAEVTEVIDSELEKLSTLEKNSSEFNVTRSYLDWLTDIPWGVMSEENFDIEEARRVLDRDHYGLEEVKDTILQFIAVGKLKGTVQGKILCLAGPPGTGKTSIAKSIAEALGREFYRFSVGGLGDVSEIKGHRRTYVGAMPGKFIQCLKSTGKQNPLVLIDEIDKLGRDFRGDPASALLEVLDPSQNSAFRDHFLDVPVDMSKVLFMCTANNLDTIPGPLLDRMEIIMLSGYDVPEKVAIAQQYLVPKSLRENGLVTLKKEEETDEGDTLDGKGAVETTKEMKQGDPIYVNADGVPTTLSVEGSAIESLVRWYCREAGVRSLAKHIDKITRKLALQVVAETEGTELTEKTKRKSDTWTVDSGNLDEYVGKPIFTSDRLYEKDPLPSGIVMGLAWTSMGGSALYVETQAIKRGLNPEGKHRGGGTLKSTGQLGEVMSESTQIAYTVARARLHNLDSGNLFFDENDIHMHVPEGATPKDGPSAGVTMITAMLSLALDRPVRNDLAMTGEVSLTGKVLPVGGIKEKTMAARRAGIKCLIFPTANKRDFDEMPDYLKEDLEVHYADDYSKVFEVAFGSNDGNSISQ